MAKELSVFEEFPDFSAASKKARELAGKFGETTGVERRGTGWAVLVPPHMLPEPEDFLDDFNPLPGEPDTQDPFDEEYEKEVLEPLREEVNDDQDSWARSDDDGWYYEE